MTSQFIIEVQRLFIRNTFSFLAYLPSHLFSPLVRKCPVAAISYWALCGPSPLRGPDRRPDAPRTWQARSRLLRLVRGREQGAPVRSRTHLVSRRRGHEVVTFPYLPSAAERPKHRGEAERNVGRGAGQAVLRLKEILFRGQYGG